MKDKKLKDHLESVRTLLNAKPMDDFEGRSPSEIHYYVHNPFDKNSPFQFSAAVANTTLEKIPFLKLASAFYQYVAEQPKPNKLTTRGNLPIKLVQHLYQLGFVKEPDIESGILKLYKEQDSLSIHTLAIISTLSGITANVGNKLVLTVLGKELVEKNDLLGIFKTLFQTYVSKFNWSYHDGYGDTPVAQLAAIFSLELLSKYGDREREDKFYADKYLKAFPAILDYIEPTSYSTLEQIFSRCYSLRTFDRFMHLFGLVEIREEGKFTDRKRFIKKTEIVGKLFTFD